MSLSRVFSSRFSIRASGTLLNSSTSEQKLKRTFLAPVSGTNLNGNCHKQKHISTVCLMTKENMKPVDEIFWFNFKQFIQLAIMNNTSLLGGLGHCPNPALAERFPYFSDLLLCCILPWKPKRSFCIAMETNQYKYIYTLFIDQLV